MPRKRLDQPTRMRPSRGDLVTRLADELKNHHETGQPLVYEQEFEGGRIRSTVVWDEWDRLSLEDRTSVILEAYRQAEGPEYRARVVLASGLTVPEAESAGMLPFQVITALRSEDAVTLEECLQAMIDVGASTLLDPQLPQLRFATRDEAEATRRELINRLPSSEPVWLITQDVGKVDDWLER